MVLNNPFLASGEHLIGKELMKCEATETNASFGHGWYQSMVHPDTRAGNFNDRIRNASPIGEKQITTWRFSFTRSRNQFIVFSGVGGSLGHSLFMIGANSVTISPCSSFVKIWEANPEARTLLTYSRNASSFISWSVKRNVVLWPFTPQFRKRTFRSSIKFEILYDRVTEIWNVLYEAMKEASLVKLCLPLPPTPT